jgi:tetratricopeptide (TPR) repeat protein
MAEKAFLKSLELEPSLEEPRNELIKMYEIQNRNSEVARVYREMLIYNPDNHKSTLDLALHYRQMGQNDEALQLLSELSMRSADDGSVISAVFESLLETKQYEKAAWVLDVMLQGDSNNSDLNYLAGIAYDGLKNNQLALDHMLKVAPSSRFYANALVHGALLYHDNGQTEKAIAHIQSGLAQEPDNVEFYLYLGSFYEELDRFEDALTALHNGLEIDNNNARLHFRTGVIYDKMGLKQDSIEAMKAVVRIDPEDAEALNYLGYTYADLGIQLEEAEQLIQSALKIKPDDGYITDSLGWVYFKRQEYGEALKWLNKAAELVPDDPVILEHLGDVHAKMNNKEKAIHYYQRSLEQDPKDPQAIKKKLHFLIN